MLFLQMDKGAGRLDETLEIIRFLRFRPQPKVFEHIVRFVVTLLVPATKESEITRIFRDLVRRQAGRRAA